MAACLLLAGCGAPKGGNIRVRIGNPGNGLQTWCLPITLAHSLGYYKEEGLDVSLENLASGAKSMQALVGGSVDVGGFLYERNLEIAAEGQHVRSFFIMTRRDGRVLIVAPKANERVRRAEDLKGGLIGVSTFGAGNHQLTNYYLAAHGVRPSEISAVAIGLGASALAAIEAGRVDAAMLSGGDHFHLLRRHPGLRILVDTSTLDGMRETYGNGAYAGGALSAKQEWLDRNPDTARRLARALQHTLQWLGTHTPEEIRERLPESFRSQDAAVDLDIIRWSLPSFPADGTMQQGAPETMKRFLDASVDKVRNAKIDLAATWTNEFLPGPK